MSGEGTRPSQTLTLAALGAGAVIGLAALSAVLAVVAAQGTCPGAGVGADPSAIAERGIPAAYLGLYRQAGRAYRVPWPVLAAIGSLETDHGRSRAPGVRSGINRHGCCAGPMQFNLRDGPPSTWQRYGTDANHDGRTDVYDPEDAIPAAANYPGPDPRVAHGGHRPRLLLPAPTLGSVCGGMQKFRHEALMEQRGGLS